MPAAMIQAIAQHMVNHFVDLILTVLAETADLPNKYVNPKF